MIKKVCDKCGESIPDNLPWMPVGFPYLEIRMHINVWTTRDIHLCENCIKEFDKWIGGTK